jgi:hypothetical protein
MEEAERFKKIGIKAPKGEAHEFAKISSWMLTL